VTTPTQADVSFKSIRRGIISQSKTQIGIDYVVVEQVDGTDEQNQSPQKWNLNLFFIPKVETEPTIIPHPLPEPRQIRITGVTPLVSANIQVESVKSGTDDNETQFLVVTIRTGNDAAKGVSALPTYVLTIEDVHNLDPFFNHVAFSLAIDSPSNFDPSFPLPEVYRWPSGPDIDYLARDYNSFRQLMLNRLSVIMPQWVETSPADLGHVLVEALAYAADQLSYYQDAVATEAYLGTARRRVSVRRHARLLDYTMHEGCNARTWVHIKLDKDSDAVKLCKGTPLRKGTPLLAGGGDKTVIEPDSPDYYKAINQGAKVFETMHCITLYPAHNEIDFYTWGAQDFYLPAGTTQATLNNSQNHLNLRVGDVLIFEQVKDVETGSPLNNRYHAIRLTRVKDKDDKGKPLVVDPLGGQFLEKKSSASVQLVEIEWGLADALPFPMIISKQVGNTTHDKISVARGNIVLADYGETIKEENLDPSEVPVNVSYRPHLRHSDLTYSVPYYHEIAKEQPASVALSQDAQKALPVITLNGEDDTEWTACSDLLNSARNDSVFVVEMENDRTAYLRFGDGTLGKKPSAGDQFKATYRVGNGMAGNVGRETISHIVTRGDVITEVRNILPAQGGTEPELIEQVRHNAPYAFQSQERCVIEADYDAIAERHPEVKKAKATRKWTGSWYTTFLVIDRENNRPVDVEFQQNLAEFMQPYLLAEADIQIRPPRFVPLEIAMDVYIAPNHFPSTVKQTLLETFSNVDLPNGQRGFFHPDNMSFGQPVYLSQVVACAEQVTGVLWVEVKRFRRWRSPDELKKDFIPIGPLEIARLDNNPNAPEYGQISFVVKTSQK